MYGIRGPKRRELIRYGNIGDDNAFFAPDQPRHPARARFFSVIYDRPRTGGSPLPVSVSASPRLCSSRFRVGLVRHNRNDTKLGGSVTVSPCVVAYRGGGDGGGGG